MYKCLLLSLELPSVQGLFSVSATSLDTNFNSLNVLVSANDLIFFLVPILLLALDDLVSSVNIFIVIWIVPKVLEFLFDLLIFLIIVLSIVIFLFLLVIIILELFKQLDVFGCWVTIERRAAIMDNVDFSQSVNEVVVVERSMWVKDKVHHFFVCFVVPLSCLVDKPSTVDED
jgi:hypothetical protein